MKYFLIFIFICAVWAFIIEPQLIVIKEYRGKFFESDYVKKIIFVSDFHISKNDKKRLEKIVKQINKQNPDLVLSGGDYIKGHTGNTTMPIEEQVKFLSKINAPVISVLGNHDGWYDKYRVKKALERNGIKVLMNSNIKFNDLYIAGVEDLQTGIPNIETALENTESSKILLTHTPDIYYDVKEKVDLILSGHVHGGQVRIPFYGSIIVPSKYGNKFACGIYKETENTMIVTKGLGTSILNVRFNAVPEIVVINNE